MEVRKMEWLKSILEKAVIIEGKLDVEGLMKTINTEFAKNAVPKSVFNDTNEQLKTATKTIEELKKSNSDNEELQKKIKEHEDTIKNLQSAAENTKKEYALKDELKKLGVTDVDYLIYKHGGLEKFNFDKEGKAIGLEETIKGYKESIPHIFKTSTTVTNYIPANGTGSSLKNPFAKESFNLTEQGRLLKENPEQAKELAQMAGVTI